VIQDLLPLADAVGLGGGAVLGSWLLELRLLRGGGSASTAAAAKEEAEETVEVRKNKVEEEERHECEVEDGSGGQLSLVLRVRALERFDELLSDGERLLGKLGHDFDSLLDERIDLLEILGLDVLVEGGWRWDTVLETESIDLRGDLVILGEDLLLVFCRDLGPSHRAGSGSGENGEVLRHKDA